MTNQTDPQQVLAVARAKNPEQTADVLRAFSAAVRRHEEPYPRLAGRRDRALAAIAGGQ